MIRKERLTQQFLNFTKIDSPSFHERQMADYVKEVFAGLGIPLCEDDANVRFGSEAGNLYGRLEGELEGDPLLFLGHLDTVEPAKGRKAVLHPDGTITSAGDTVLGADDQSGLSEIIEAIRSIEEDGKPHRTLEFLISFAEEAFTKGSRYFDWNLLEAKQGYTLDLDAPIGTASLWEPTLIEFTIDITGRSAHAGFHPEQGINAIRIAADILTELPLGRVDPETVLNVGIIRGGTAKNAVPGTVHMEGELRSRCHDRALSLLESIRETAGEKAAALGGTAKVQYDIDLHEYRMDPDEPVVRRFVKAAERAGIQPVLSGSFGGSDNNQFAQHGGHGIVLASAMFDCHTVHEYTTVEDLFRAAQIVENLMTSEL